MIKEIKNVNAKEGRGEITFDVVVDGSCDEKVFTNIDGDIFSTALKHDSSDTFPDHVIVHTKSGPHVIELEAEKSKVKSGPFDLNL